MDEVHDCVCMLEGCLEMGRECLYCYCASVMAGRLGGDKTESSLAPKVAWPLSCDSSLSQHFFISE